MSRRLSRISLALVIFLSSEVWALGLGDITMNSGLNQPLNARIELLSATAEELDNLTIALASSDTFERYGIDRPFYLQDLQFNIVRSGRADGNYVQVTSLTPMAEPFLTFLVEASWSRGRLLREYTVFLDPPTFAPQTAETAPPVQAPTRTAPADSARIERTAPPPAPTPQPRTSPAPAPAATTRPAAEPAPTQQPQPVVDDRPYSTQTGDDYIVERGDTLWGLAARIRPDSRLTMNQTMLAIFEANPQAFGGNINLLRAGAAVRIPSADEIFRIDRADALAEAQRQHTAWEGGVSVAEEPAQSPSLTLVPPDEDFTEEADTFVPEPEPEPEPDIVSEPLAEELTPREQEILDRIAELEGADVPQQQSLIEIRDNELAQLRQELANIRSESYDPGIDESLGADTETDVIDPMDEDLVAESDADESADDAEPADTTRADNVISSTPRRSKPSLMDQIIGYATGIYGIIAGALILVGGALFWFMRRGRDEEDIEDWQPLDRDEMIGGDMTSTETMAAPEMDESIVVVEQESMGGSLDDTMEADTPTMDFDTETTGEFETAPPLTESFEQTPSTDETGRFDSLEDTFSSETAINLDQSDPIAEADFHMAYGLYDQAADLINGALSAEPERPDLLTKLCEIYFVWGNRDAFIDAAGRLSSVVGDGDSADWDKIVIMGQQIAADDELFAGASAAGATKAVDLDFEEGGDDIGALDMDFGAESDGSSDIFDVGSDDDSAAAEGDESVDFMLESTGESEPVVDITAESPTGEPASVDFDPTNEYPASEETAGLPVDEDDTAETSPSDETLSAPTIEEQFDVLSGTSELPSLDDTQDQAVDSTGQTAEINLDELGLDVDSMAETELGSLDDIDSTGRLESVEDTGISDDASEDLTAVTGKLEALDVDATGLQEALGDPDETAIDDPLEDTGISEPPDESLLDATGLTQVLGDDFAVDASDSEDDDKTMLATDLEEDSAEAELPDDAETMLASLDDDDADEFDFAKTEALPKDSFGDETKLDETGEMPAVASTDVELDLDDLTAALQVGGDAGDTVEQPRDDATVEYPRPEIDDDTVSSTMSIGPDEMSDDLSDARTMTEVGTKLDLARAYVDMGDPAGARSILEEVLDEGDEGQRQQAQQLLDTLPS